MKVTHQEFDIWKAQFGTSGSYENAVKYALPILERLFDDQIPNGSYATTLQRLNSEYSSLIKPIVFTGYCCECRLVSAIDYITSKDCRMSLLSSLSRMNALKTIQPYNDKRGIRSQIADTQFSMETRGCDPST